MSKISSKSNVPDDLVERAKKARETSAALKIQLINLRQKIPQRLIFVFEGKDDVTAYMHWIKRIDSKISFEPFVCNGKRNVLSLRSSVQRDTDDLADGVYFYIDRDFDDSAGAELGTDIFMCEAYSIENYLVNEEVLEELLKDELQCHGFPEAREEIIRQFSKVYREFLSVTCDLNFYLYCGKKLGSDLANSVPDKINKIVAVSLDGVAELDPPVEKAIEAAIKSHAQFSDGLRADFELMDPPMRFRGKFSLMFFFRWLELLARERIDRLTALTASLSPVTRTRFSQINIGTMAARSAIPKGLAEFAKAANEGNRG
ncbi:DUF4435 domain-containing protein [Labrys sp. 22185]|uniref:DUF4435 domain-containing protein n=1 Tax=Labrys sp. 22185 TaxID=3453888 RepID=UPI003F87D448